MAAVCRSVCMVMCLAFSEGQLVLARAYATRGATDSAQRALEAALSETERRRSGIVSAEDRAHFLDQARPVIDSFVMFRLAQGDTLGALDFIERMRARAPGRGR